MQPRTVLLVEDESNMALVLQMVLEQAQIVSVWVTDGAAALELLKKRDFDAILSDLLVPGMGGEELLSVCQKQYSGIPVVIMTAFGTIESAKKTIKQGAFDYVTKPFHNAELIAVLHQAFAESDRRKAESLAVSALGFKEFKKIRTQALERSLIQEALTQTDGNVTKAAALLGLSRKGLQLKLKELNF